MDPERMLTPAEIADLGGYHVMTVRNALRSGELRGELLRRHWYVREEDAIEWLGPRAARAS
jgi:excisionase family DNA binding protein